ncbi:uncharacterized protein LOC128742279 [Sabethes cyaneus]|uniref:uncharacterized protein LOC128742279 n=1 Tax=Sabethes cyaneus TaxID=53552 RepID=UPI00237E3635|nr:uncharacterized protein LOC128742279 [Sabethes cyaneus]XP_053694579.1 uncharacterized protein LOC128742279 [Sabethes cyaneus]XP_053694587.1 uncharacterized protein LOC128742279 [Sabethes cyaneus]XP_053694595.1 uncharacterized protein LOC128742279 [Sabethes cyaneus]
MDLSDAMKIALAKSHSSQAAAQAQAVASGNSSSAVTGGHGSSADQSGAGYVTEKLYMLLQLYLQNKGWSPSVELLQCFAELKDTPVLPSAAYLQVLASRVALDAQGRLVLRESGKIILPYEHFANAVMLKHMSGPHGLHLSVEATVRAVVESYTIGRENLGMEKEFIVEVVQSCPSPACRYYKGQIGVGPFIEQSFNPTNHLNSDYLAHLQQLGQSGLDIGAADPGGKSMVGQVKIPKTPSTQQQQITAAIIQQQNRAMAQQSLEKFGNLTNLEKQRVLQQLDKKHYETVVQSQVPNLSSQLVPANNNNAMSAQTAAVVNNQQVSAVSLLQQQQQQAQTIDISRAQQQVQVAHSHIQPQQLVQQINTPTPSQLVAAQQSQLAQPPLQTVNMDTGHKLSDYMRGAVDPLENMTTSKDLLALHNGAWPQDGRGDGLAVSQDKIIRAFGELMRNIARMKTFIRPSMCKPYGKQSESLQKTLFDTIQLVQSLRNCLPAPHIPVSSWKSETHTGSNGSESV